MTIAVRAFVDAPRFDAARAFLVSRGWRAFSVPSLSLLLSPGLRPARAEYSPFHARLCFRPYSLDLANPGRPVPRLQTGERL